MQTSLIVRPSLRKVKFALLLCVLFLCFLLYVWWAVLPEAHWSAPLVSGVHWSILVIGLLPFLFPLSGWLTATRTELTIEGGLVRSRQGLLSETLRSTELRKIQDIRVERTVGQRMWGLGTLVLETSSEQGRIVVEDVERPQQIADQILAASRQDGERG
jgi:membrane protein YdbS with pleckstrin-like domain